MTADEIRRYNEARQILKEIGYNLTGVTRGDVIGWIDAEGYEWTGEGWRPRQRKNTTDLENWLEETRDEAWAETIEPLGRFNVAKALHLVEMMQRAMEMLEEAQVIVNRAVGLMDTDQLGRWQGVRGWCEVWQDYVINGKPEVQK